MFTYILSDKRKSTAFVARGLTGFEVLILVKDFTGYVLDFELCFYTLILINEDTGSTMQVHGGDICEKVFS